MSCKEGNENSPVVETFTFCLYYSCLLFINPHLAHSLPIWDHQSVSYWPDTGSFWQCYSTSWFWSASGTCPNMIVQQLFGLVWKSQELKRDRTHDFASNSLVLMGTQVFLIQIINEPINFKDINNFSKSNLSFPPMKIVCQWYLERVNEVIRVHKRYKYITIKRSFLWLFSHFNNRQRDQGIWYKKWNTH